MKLNNNESPKSVKVIKIIMLVAGLTLLAKSGALDETTPYINDKECNIGIILCLVALFKRIRLGVQDLFSDF